MNDLMNWVVNNDPETKADAELSDEAAGEVSGGGDCCTGGHFPS
ncbi:MAG: hypothetical protein ACLQBJ_14165 [Bryobacteraceae bacterium]